MIGRLHGGLCAFLVLLSAASAHAQSPQPISPQPAVEIGASMSDARDQLGRVVAARRLEDGTLVILDGLPAAVRIYGPDGSFVRQIGRPGQGPGEFGDPVSLEVVGRQIHVLDRDGRVNVFDLEGGIVQTRRVNPEGRLDERFNGQLDRILPDGRILIRGPERLFGRVRGEYRQMAALATLGPDDRLTRLGVFAADTGRTDTGDVAVPRPYLPGEELLLASHPTGLVVLDPYGSVRLIDRGGETVMIRELSLSRSQVTAADVEAAREAALEPITGANDVRVVTEWLDGMPRASRTPVARSILAEPGGVIWVETWLREGGQAQWLLFRPDGSALGMVLAPSGLRLLQVGASAVLGVWRDPYGVERVRVHAR